MWTGTEEVGLAAMEGWQWTPGTTQGEQWMLGGGQPGGGGPQPGSLEGVDSLPEAMAKSRQEASRRVSRSNSRQFERLSSQVRILAFASIVTAVYSTAGTCKHHVTHLNIGFSLVSSSQRQG